MPKVVVNACFGGFGLSHDAIMRYGELANLNLVYVKGDHRWGDRYFKDGIQDDENSFWEHDIERNDPILVQVVEELGEAADGEAAELRIADVPDDAAWYLDDYDGIETIREVHRTW
jgi:hypothetical protein